MIYSSDTIIEDDIGGMIVRMLPEIIGIEVHVELFHGHPIYHCPTKKRGCTLTGHFGTHAGIDIIHGRVVQYRPCSIWRVRERRIVPGV